MAKLSVEKALLRANSYAKKGDIEEAQKLYHAVLQAFPKNKRAQQGFAALNKPKQPTATQGPPQEVINHIINLYKQGQLQQALKRTEILIQQFPKSATLFNIKGALLCGLGQLEPSVEAYKRALAIKPDFADAHNNMGIVLKEQVRLDEAIDSYMKALAINPNFADAYYNLGIVFEEQGKLNEAIVSYRKALAIKPDNAEAYNNMGIVLKEQAKLNEAIDAYMKALAIKPDYAEAFYNMGKALKGIRFVKADQHIEDAIISILEHKTVVRPIDISLAALSLIKCQPKFKDLLPSEIRIKSVRNFEEISQTISTTPLLLKLMSVCPLPDLDFERLLCGLRSFIVKNIADITVDCNLLKLQSALALQCFTNEYVYDYGKSDAEALHKLEEIVSNTLKNGAQPEPHIILCLASFTALHEYEWSDLLQNNDDIEDVIRRQITEPNEEYALKQKMRVLGKINDVVSSKVRQQYEENPYPRWVNLGLRRKPASISQVSKELKLKLSNKGILSLDTPNILIAGCGTGQHAIGTKSALQNSKVLAIDLSLSSLAYAKRKTQELGINNIDYMQADILQLRSFYRQFDIIESVGVLHHMDDPIAGWEVLVDCLKPGGLMKIGLYSELARKPVVDCRNRLAQAGTAVTLDNIRSLRAVIAKSEDDGSKQIRLWQDYFSMSELRDLLFHVQEHRFTIPLIKDCLNQLRLEFCGFEENEIVSAFKQANPTKDAEYCLDAWLTFEQDNPKIFTGMYQFWCQKI